ncbi:prokaryotic ubiquitin-like protein Pup [Bifidobacterium lemurum]|uniref:Prokaryotic ubiquitin-like protein Pup n=1 Tax=Bifidobacterium lemurum TaxID=1603886 RepID=A0A261FSW6_9BIFI|nr:ubiquitin-like protein Pup [Bifidobacterium lemurum]OZG62281.1 prokaryotic ubiquitin-like protein Pup [Bifidobacterium lemurum]QOL33648.1 ubiquitin-like protein Pup [Bifidobacterium lemurum]
MPQEFEQAQAAAETVAEQESAAVTSQETSDQLDALDAVLDDIESTLATNAEEYVSSFVQKGGE